MGQESAERKSWQSVGRQGAARCKVQRQKAGPVTRLEVKICGQEQQKAGQLPGDSSGKEQWKVVHDLTTI